MFEKNLTPGGWPCPVAIYTERQKSCTTYIFALFLQIENFFEILKLSRTYAYNSRVFPWNFILGDTSPHRHLLKGTFQVILGDNLMTFNQQIANFRGHYVSH